MSVGEPQARRKFRTAPNGTHVPEINDLAVDRFKPTAGAEMDQPAEAGQAIREQLEKILASQLDSN